MNHRLGIKHTEYQTQSGYKIMRINTINIIFARSQACAMETLLRSGMCHKHPESPAQKMDDQSKALPPK